MTDEEKEIEELRAEIQRLRTSDRVIEMARNVAFNDLYAVVTIQYGHWDEGETVDWRRVNEVCRHMIGAFEMSGSGYISIEE